MVDIWRLEIAKKGVDFNSTPGYDKIFEKQLLEQQVLFQKINKQRAIEGELMKTIKHIRGVKSARVHLSLPNRVPLYGKKKPPSGSIVLT